MCIRDRTYTAISYTLNQWSKLVVYCEEGKLRISNILAENAIRPFVIGRKAWLFADTTQGANASAVCYSLVETAKLNGLEPYLTNTYTPFLLSCHMQKLSSKSRHCYLGT